MQTDKNQPKLEDVFAGQIELTATERGYLHNAVHEVYTKGGWCPGEDRRDFARRVLAKLSALQLVKMVTPDGSRLVTVDEHAAIIVDIERQGMLR